MNALRYFLFTLSGLCLSIPYAQVTWQTTHTSIKGYNSGFCDLVHASLRVKVFPAYLDVEEDVELAPVGAVQAGNDSKTLEIMGNFTLPSGAAITGALLWDGTHVLAGTLLDRTQADSLYNSLVERNSTPPARPLDPLILEALGKDAYRFRIYPAETAHTRHLRLRYQLPPTIGAEGLEIALRAAIIPLFSAAQLANVGSAGSLQQITVTFENGGSVPKAIYALGNDIRTEMVFPRTKLLKPEELAGPQTTYGNWGNWQFNPGARIYPTDPLRQVMVKTSFPSGAMTGNYLNLYTSVTEDVLRGLHQRVEVVVFWKWHNPGTWIDRSINSVSYYGDSIYGDYPNGNVYQAQSQAAVILDLYRQLGGAGTKVGLLHDDSKAQHQFHAASRNDTNYARALDYLQQVQGGYIETFARGIKVLKAVQGQPLNAGIVASKARFLTNMRIVKTLYSPETGVIRHLIFVSTGGDQITDDNDMNTEMDKIFTDEKVSVATLGGFGFNQAGFDFWEAKRNHTYSGLTVPTPFGDLPGLPTLNLNVVIRNTKKAYDFSIACSGGLDMACGNLTFHGKSDQVWNDTLSWEAYDRSGKLLATTTSVPTQFGKPSDTAVAILWAGSDNPYSEKHELPLGPVYGFVDRWASLLSMPKDTLPSASAAAYADTGVPHIANQNLKDIIPNYADGQVPVGDPTGLVAKVGSLANPDAWQVVRGHGNVLLVKIPGLVSGQQVELEWIDLMGKRAGTWSIKSGSGAFSLDVSHMRAGVYLLKIRVAGIQGTKRIAL